MRRSIATTLAASTVISTCVVCVANVAQARPLGTLCENGSVPFGSGTCAISFTSVGTSTWTVPTGVSELHALIVGAGGGGGGASGKAGGAGGGGGQVRQETVPVTAGVAIHVTVGGGGEGGTGGNGGWFPATEVLVGDGASGTQGGASSIAVATAGPIKATGGYGGDGAITGPTAALTSPVYGGSSGSEYPGGAWYSISYFFNSNVVGPGGGGAGGDGGTPTHLSYPDTIATLTTTSTGGVGGLALTVTGALYGAGGGGGGGYGLLSGGATLDGTPGNTYEDTLIFSPHPGTGDGGGGGGGENGATCTAWPPMLHGVAGASGFVRLVFTPGTSSTSNAASAGARLASTPTGTGWWEVRSDGGVFSYGTAQFHGSLPGLGMRIDDVTSIASSCDGAGYWLAGADGGVFAFGDAYFYGSLPLHHVTPVAPIVAIRATSDCKGYWLIGADGGVFAFGDATFYGSLPLHHVTPVAPVVDVTPTPTGDGYYLVGADGGVFSFGDATFYGSLPYLGLQVHDVVGIVMDQLHDGYYLVAADGGVFAFGGARFLGSEGGASLSSAVTGLIVHEIVVTARPATKNKSQRPMGPSTSYSLIDGRGIATDFNEHPPT